MKIEKDVLISRQNATIKWAASLKEKKVRDEFFSFVAEGEKLTFEAFEAGLPVTHVFVSESKREKVLTRLTPYFNLPQYEKTVVITTADAVFEKISTEKAPQGVISIIKYLDFFRELDIIYKEDFFLQRGERAVALCSVRDPGNLGSVIRSCVAFGVEHIIVTADTVDIYNPKTVRSAMGSLFKVKITTVKQFESFVKTASELGRRVYAAELTDAALSLSDVKLSADDIFIIGNEGHGIPKDISALCTASVYIPISSKTESLNASVAAAILMWEQGK